MSIAVNRFPPIKIKELSKSTILVLKDEVLEWYYQQLAQSLTEHDSFSAQKDMSIISELHQKLSAPRFMILQDNKTSTLTLPVHQVIVLSEAMACYSMYNNEALTSSLIYKVQDQLIPKLI